MKKLIILFIFAIIAIQINFVLNYRNELIDSPIKVNLTLKPLNA